MIFILRTPEPLEPFKLRLAPEVILKAVFPGFDKVIVRTAPEEVIDTVALEFIDKLFNVLGFALTFIFTLVLIITSSFVAGTPLGDQLPLVFQLALVAPIHVLVAACENNVTNRKASINAVLFIQFNRIDCASRIGAINLGEG
jgi:hypothetical protein